MKVNRCFSTGRKKTSENNLCQSNYYKYLNPSLQKIPKSGIRKYFDVAVGLNDVISLGVGEPDFITPWNIREACIQSLEKGKTTYTSNYGLVELREEISKKYIREYGIYYDPNGEIIVTAGVSEAVDLAIRCLICPGDEVLVVEPSYVSYIPIIILSGGIPIPIVTKSENDFRLTPDDLLGKITEKTKLIIFNYPNNPTGAVMKKKDFESISDIIVNHDLFVLSDEIYEELTYEGKHIPFSQIDGMKERTIIVNGFSKAYSMTGLRVGYALSMQPIISAMMLIHQYTMLCAPTTAQIGAIEALKKGDDEMHKTVREYNRRRRLMVDGFNALGLNCFEPLGSFYAFPSISITNLTSQKFCNMLLKDYHVITIPGDAFGECGEGHMRCAYAASHEDIAEALSRLDSFLKKLKHKKY